MNRKVSKQFEDIKDIYLLQCICTEQNDEIERLQDMDKILRNENINLKLRINKARELLNQEWYSVLRKETITKVKEILDKEK